MTVFFGNYTDSAVSVLMRKFSEFFNLVHKRKLNQFIEIGRYNNSNARINNNIVERKMKIKFLNRNGIASEKFPPSLFRDVGKSALMPLVHRRRSLETQRNVVSLKFDEGSQCTRFRTGYVGMEARRQSVAGGVIGSAKALGNIALDYASDSVFKLLEKKKNNVDSHVSSPGFNGMSRAYNYPSRLVGELLDEGFGKGVRGSIILGAGGNSSRSVAPIRAQMTPAAPVQSSRGLKDQEISLSRVQGRLKDDDQRRAEGWLARRALLPPSGSSGFDSRLAPDWHGVGSLW